MDKYIKKWRNESQKLQKSQTESILQNENSSNNAESSQQSENDTSKAELSQSSQDVQNKNSSNDVSLSERQCKQFFLLQNTARIQAFLF